MSYYFAKTVDTPFQQTVEGTVAKLKDQGFGVLTKMDVQATLKEKIAAPIFDPHQALQAEDKVGTMLPCNVIVQEVGGTTEVAAVDPVASMQAIKNDKLAAVANKVRQEPKPVIESV